MLDHAFDEHIHEVASAAYISYDLPDSRRVRGVEDPSHQHGFDRVPHNPGGRVGLQFLHQIIAERSCTETFCVIYVTRSIEREYGKWINCLSAHPNPNIPCTTFGRVKIR